MESKLRKAHWIANEINANADDVYDVLLGNITAPWELVNSVNAMATDYDNLRSKVVFKEGLGG